MRTLVKDPFAYTLADRDHYEPIARVAYNPADYVRIVQRLLPGDWQTAREGVWYHCMPPKAELPQQGWKIHLSATVSSSAPILAAATRILAVRGIPFKFTVDRTFFLLMNSKRWDRGRAGKFMTVYPRNEAECGALLECLYRATIGYDGPYILSDRRYRDSKVVHYRYGQILPAQSVNSKGEHAGRLVTPGGDSFEDQRLPYFYLPKGIADPFVVATPPDQADDGERGTLNDGRYVLRSVLNFSNSGGVYLATDVTTGNQVLIKEARPFTSPSKEGLDAIAQLAREYRLLCALADTGVAPRPLDFFRDWEHYFLVEEFLPGIVLRGYAARHSIVLRNRPSASDAAEFFARYRRLFVRLAEMLAVLHERGIVFSDVSHHNVMVLGDGDDVKLIDFGGAFEPDVEAPSLIITPGFFPATPIARGEYSPADDRFGLGALMFAALFPVNAVLQLDPTALSRFLAAYERDFGLPGEFRECIQGLMTPDEAARLPLGRVIEILERPQAPVEQPCISTAEADASDLTSLVDEIVDYTLSVASYERHDRLFPSDPAAYQTNPLSIAYGATGVAFALHRLGRKVPEPILDWSFRHELSTRKVGPGLYSGLSGIAWGLLELGLSEKADQLMRSTHSDSRVWESPDVFHGAAGWGMAQLRMFLATQDEEYLERACEAGEFLIATAETDDAGRHRWPSHGEVSCGLAHGASGVSLFLLYLYQVTQREETLAVGRGALDYVLSKAITTRDGGASWHAIEGQPSYTPYWRWGSAGIGSVLLRYQRALGTSDYFDMLERVFIDTDIKYAIFPGRMFGLAGTGEFLLDLAEEPAYAERARHAARKILSGILLFKIPRPGGAAFPGEGLSRISCDYGTGGMGIAVFIERLASGSRAPFMLDELLHHSHADR